jgi:alpha-tubulin suppressor-like RCC1 family protein
VLANTSGVLAGKSITAVSSEGGVTCAVADARAYCWGSPFAGRLGNNTYTEDLGAPLSPPVPVDTSGVLAGKTATAISVGPLHVCVLADGKAYCWGSNFTGGLGHGRNNGSGVPVAVDTSGVLAGKTVTAISAEEAQTCVVADGKAYCWGRNSSGQLGNNDRSDASLVPVAVGGVLANKLVTAIDVGTDFTCAVAEGRAYCWGDGSTGQLGFDQPLGSPLPSEVGASVLRGKTVTAISAGRDMHARWRTPKPIAGAKTSSASWATTPPRTWTKSSPRLADRPRFQFP